MVDVDAFGTVPKYVDLPKDLGGSGGVVEKTDEDSAVAKAAP